MKIKQIIIALVLTLASGLFINTSLVSAESTCAGTKTSIISCNSGNSTDPLENNGIWALLLMAINILTSGIAIMAVGGIIYSAILYASAEGSADQVKKAKATIKNIVIGLAAYALMYAFMNFIIPGGVFS